MKLPKPSDSGGDFVVPEPGVYKMEFTDYDEPVLSTFKKKNGDDQYRIKLVFTIRDEESDYDGEEIWAWYGWSMHEKSHLYPVIKALLGRDIEDDEEPDLDELLGKFIMGTLDNKTKDNGKTFANLIAASPVRRKGKEAKAPAKPAPKAEESDETEEDAALWGETDAA